MKGPNGRGKRASEDPCIPRDASEACSGSTTSPKDSQAFQKHGILGQVTVYRGHNVDEDPNLCGYHMDAGRMTQKSSIGKVTGSSPNAAAAMKRALE